MHAKVDYISASCNLRYNSLDLTSDGSILYGSSSALAIYNLKNEKVTHTLAAHKGRVNCVRFVKESNESYLLTSCSKGTLNLWKYSNNFCEQKLTIEPGDGECIGVVDGIIVSENELLIVCVITERICIYKVNISDFQYERVQEIKLDQNVILEAIFYKIFNQFLLALGLDDGTVVLYKSNIKDFDFQKCCVLTKHEDWVRCIALGKFENEVLLASGGQDSFIAIWKFTDSLKKEKRDDFEFQVYSLEDFTIVFESMIIGHEGWINSLQWNNNGELLSCSSDQSIIIWQNCGEFWSEKQRFGTMGGEIPGGFGAKFLPDLVVYLGFHGAIQIWKNSVNEEDENEWKIKSSVTGHFSSVNDLDWNPEGKYIVTTSKDQTTRIHAKCHGLNKWNEMDPPYHEISRAQIHGHDIFAVKTLNNFIVSGSEEKILRAFQPTEIFVENLQEITGEFIDIPNVSASASIPALGLSNQADEDCSYSKNEQTNILDEDYIRAQTLWQEVAKLYGHVYEIACLATCHKLDLIASGSHSNKAQFSSIILWSSKDWKNLGEFSFHKLNVEDLEFSPNGQFLLSSSRDRTWCLWTVEKLGGEEEDYTLKLFQSSNFHTKALWVGTWAPDSNLFATGSRDKKIALWMKNSILNKEGKEYSLICSETLKSSVSAASINSENIIALGLEFGEIILFKLICDNNSSYKLQFLEKFDKSFSHHGLVKRLKFNPCNSKELASCGEDNIFKVYSLTF